ncbi:MAG: T9SS type A sorting domain-containing protein, partial [Gemmatimonadetes bacterium]|nr:T9SS type A sorting domain-containing protein [Gemmatimonadota bacterium]
SFIGLVLSVSVGAEPLLEGQVILSSGQPAPGVEVMLFDLSDLQRGAIARTTTDATGSFAVAVSRARGRALPDGFALGQNYPNPFNPSTIIPYHLSASSHVRLEVFNLLGQRLATLVDAEQAAGAHTALWDATNAAGQAVSAGVYIYRLTVGTKRQTGRMVLIDGQAGVPAAGTPQPVPLAEVAQDRDYGLVVSGRGIALYIVPAFRVEAGMAPVDLVVEASGSTPRPKVAEGGILGDVDGNGVVDIVDALIVAMYSVYPSIDLPSNSNISLGDVNYDGQIDFIDAYLIGTYSVDPSDPLLPEGIGQAVTVADSPNPDLGPPPPPANVRFQYGQDIRFRVSWDPSPRATFYEVYWDGAPVFSVSCPGDCEKIATVKNTSVEHHSDSFYNGYWVKACNSAGCSQWVSADWRLLLVAETVSENAVTLRLVEHTYPTTNIQDAVQLSGLGAAGVNISSVSRVSDTVVKVELTFDDTATPTESPLKFTVDAGAVANYDGPDLVVLKRIYLGVDLAVELSVDDSRPDAGEYIYLSATVQNLGSVPTPLRPHMTLGYYLSTDATISTSDIQVSTDEVFSLDPLESSDEWTRVNAPSTPGTYYYGACVPVLLGESDGTNNCSRAVPVTISGDG